MNEFKDIADKYIKESRETLEKSKQEAEKEGAKMRENVKRLEDLSMSNFTSWRDYMHKYFTVIFLLVGATGALQSEKFNDCWFRTGIFLTLGGVFVGYLFINIYFYIERRWFQAHNLLNESHAPLDHPKAITGGIREAIILNELDFIEEIKVKLKEAQGKKDKKMTKHYKKIIKQNKKLIFALKFTGEQFGLMEKIWLIGVSLSLLFTAVGIFIVFANI
ncbi:MAG: hypothetical protein WC924_01175 [Candidatus Gracilibacteria bacterium]